jgi:hypothetical protein
MLNVYLPFSPIAPDQSCSILLGSGVLRLIVFVSRQETSYATALSSPISHLNLTRQPAPPNDLFLRAHEQLEVLNIVRHVVALSITPPPLFFILHTCYAFTAEKGCRFRECKDKTGQGPQRQRRRSS